ncbi:MAG TPA: hypothetical protein VEE84_04540 [Burkholderiaceae bacterium]|nr:hypothetical protein [Burkholderiaceae bacterium]
MRPNPRCSIRVDPAVPPNAEITAKTGLIEPNNSDTVERQPGQGIAGSSGKQIGAGRRGPDLEEFLRHHLIGRVPMRNSAAFVTAQNFIANFNVTLQLRSLPVGLDRFMAALLGKWSIAVDTVGCK